MESTQGTKEAIWLRRLLKELGHEQCDPTVLFEDNKSALDLSKNPVHHDRTKHIDIQWHFVREKVESGEVILHQVRTSEQLADVFTKPLPKDKFLAAVTGLGMKVVPESPTVVGN